MPESLKSKKYERKVTSPERLFTRSPYSIVTIVARIKGHVSQDMLKNAVAKVQQRHELLQVRLKEENDRTQWFTTEGIQEIPVEIIPRKSKHDWIEICIQASKIPYEFETRPAIRFVLSQSSTNSDLIILCHHTICDGISLAYLARDLMTHLGDPSREVAVLSTPAAITLDNLPDDISRFSLIKFLIKMMNGRWVEESIPFDQEDYKILTKAYWDNYHHAIFSIEMSAAETAALVARCKQENITVNSAITAAFSGAQRFVEGKKPYQKKTLIAASLRDRLPDPPGEALGFFASSIELKLKYNHKKSFWENARRFHKKIKANSNNKKVFRVVLFWLYLEPTFFEAMTFKKLGRLIPSSSARYGKLVSFSKQKDSVLKFLKRGKMDSLETVLFDLVITNLGRMDFATTYGTLELDRLIMQPGSGFPLAQVGLVVGVATCAGKLSLVGEYAKEVIDTYTMERIKDKAFEFLRHA